MSVEPKDAATVILLRPGRTGAGLEVLMVLRHPRNKFVADSYVFPGGALDEEDCDENFEPLCRGLDLSAAAGIIPDMPTPVRSLGAWVAAVRETFEEVGIMLAYDRQGRLLAFRDEAESARFAEHRRRLNQKSITLKTILEQEKLTLATDRIFYYSHWITPELSPIRYNVRFFAAVAPEDQVPGHDGLELTGHVWITPGEALQANREGRFKMVLPTIMTLRELALFDSVERVIRSTRNKPIPAILTRLIQKENGYVEIMPDGTHFGPSPVLMD